MISASQVHHSNLKYFLQKLQLKSARRTRYYWDPMKGIELEY